MNDNNRGCLRYLFLAQPEFLAMGMMGMLGEDAKREADAVVEDMPIAIAILVVIGLIAFMLYKVHRYLSGG